MRKFIVALNWIVLAVGWGHLYFTGDPNTNTGPINPLMIGPAIMYFGWFFVSTMAKMASVFAGGGYVALVSMLFFALFLCTTTASLVFDTTGVSYTIPLSGVLVVTARLATDTINIVAEGWLRLIIESAKRKPV